MKAVLIVALIGSVFAAQLCPSYYCLDFQGQAGVTVTNPYWYFCAEMMVSRQVNPADVSSVDQYNTYLLGACPEDSKHTFCNLSNLSAGSGTFCTPTPALINLQPGQTCSTGTECISNQCSGNKCIGLAEGAACDATDKCDVGLYCSSGACKKVPVENEDCDASNPCSPKFVCSNGSCSKWFSGTEGQQPGTADVRACQSGYLSSDDKCALGNKRVNTNMTGTKAETGVCEYTDSTGAAVSTKEASVCTESTTPAAYCKIAEGDQEYIDVLDLAKAFVTNANLPECHVDLGLMCDAALAVDTRGAYAFSYLPNWVNMHSKMENNPECAKWSLNYNQWFVKEGIYPYKPGEQPNPTPTPPDSAVHTAVSFVVLVVSVLLVSL